jgi:hypothetical protein
MLLLGDWQIPSALDMTHHLLRLHGEEAFLALLLLLLWSRTKALPAATEHLPLGGRSS